MHGIIHIGMAKTGTSSFQKFLARNEKDLKKVGCLYPKSMRFNYQHALLPGCYLPDHNFLPSNRSLDCKKYIEDLRKEINSGEYYICVISSEVFNELMIRNERKARLILKKLTDLFDSYEILITTRIEKYAEYSGLRHRLRHMNKQPNCDLIPEFEVMRTFDKIRFIRKKAINKWRSLSIPKTEKTMDHSSNSTKFYFQVIVDQYKGKNNHDAIKEIGERNISNVENRDESYNYIYLTLIVSSIIISKSNYKIKGKITFNSIEDFAATYDQNIIRQFIEIKTDQVILFLNNFKNSMQESLLIQLIKTGINTQEADLLINFASEYTRKICIGNSNIFIKASALLGKSFGEAKQKIKGL